MSPRFFGNPQRPLFGIYHPARGGRGADHNVLLCPPLGHEMIRSHWAMRTLASKLARKRINVFRFDYRGTGDSSLEIEDIHSMQDLVADAVSAAIELIETAGAQSSRLSLIGLRLGGVIAAMAARQLNEDQIEADVIGWECPTNGETYLGELRSMHHQMVDLWTRQVTTENSDSHEELLGFRFTRSLLNEVENYGASDVFSDGQGERLILNSESTCSSWHEACLGQSVDNVRVLETEDPSDWDDLNYIEEAWLPIHGSSSLVDLLATDIGKPQTVSTGRVAIGASH